MPESNPSFKDRRDIFTSAIEKPNNFGERWKLTRSFGQSNKSRVMDGGLFLCNANLEGDHAESYEGHIFASVVGLPPEDEFWFAVYIESEVDTLKKRLHFMQKMGSKGDERFSDRNNNVKLYLYSDHGIYLENSGFHSGLSKEDGFAPENSRPYVQVDKIVYSIYSKSAVGQRYNVAAGAMVDRLGRFVESNQMKRIDPWPETARRIDIPQQFPPDLELTEIHSEISSLGGYYDPETIERYHVGLNHISHKHFVILTGLSGTGKTGLATKYARTIHDIDSDDQEDPFLFMCPVRPEWTDPTGLIGYYDVIGDRYVVPPFLEAMLVAQDNPDHPVFVCLDEMNLARVEYYLSDVLSAVESGEAIDLHSNSTPIQGNHGGEVPPSIHVPKNLYITGTVNIDETTQPLSDKVLDRATVVELTASGPGEYLDWLESEEPSLNDAIADCRDLLIHLHSTLEKEGLAFGYRVIEEFVRYLDFARNHGSQSDSEIIDDQIVQKIIPKLRGSHRQRGMLDTLESYFEKHNLERSQEKIRGLKDELKDLGSFQASR